MGFLLIFFFGSGKDKTEILCRMMEGKFHQPDTHEFWLATVANSMVVDSENMWGKYAGRDLIFILYLMGD